MCMNGYSCSCVMYQAIYSAFGGSGKGLQYRDLVCGLALLIYGTRQEKAKCMYL